MSQEQQKRETKKALIRETNIELKRIGWTRNQCIDYLLKYYQARSRQVLSVENLRQFLEFLKSLPDY